MKQIKLFGCVPDGVGVKIVRRCRFAFSLHIVVIVLIDVTFRVCVIAIMLTRKKS